MAVIFNSNALLQDLQQEVRSILLTTQQELKTMPEAALLRQPAPGKWSAAECLDHLNTYNRLYQPRIVVALEAAAQKGLTPVASFTSGWLGNYFTKIMQPKPDGSLALRMKSPANARPVAANLDHPQIIVTDFEAYQQQWLVLLEQSQQTNLQQIKIATTISALLKLSLGDTFRFLIAHEQRHLLQAVRAVK
jgi:hypothetical protein